MLVKVKHLYSNHKAKIKDICSETAVFIHYILKSEMQDIARKCKAIYSKAIVSICQYHDTNPLQPFTKTT